MKYKTLLTAILALACQNSFSQTNVDENPSVFGITIGQKYNVLPCNETNKTSLCEKELIDQFNTYSLEFKEDIKPTYIKRLSVSKNKDDTIDTICINTYGNKDQNLMYDKLVDYFGKPTSLSKTENSSIYAYWENKSIRVIFLGSYTDQDSGVVILSKNN